MPQGCNRCIQHDADPSRDANHCMRTNTFCRDTLSVHTDPDSLPSFDGECSFGNWSLDSYKKIQQELYGGTFMLLGFYARPTKNVQTDGQHLSSSSMTHQQQSHGDVRVHIRVDSAPPCHNNEAIRPSGKCKTLSVSACAGARKKELKPLRLLAAS